MVWWRRKEVGRRREHVQRITTHTHTHTHEHTKPKQDLIFNLYVSTIDKLFYGRQYLNEKFFRLLQTHFLDPLCLVIAKDKEGKIVAGTFNIISNSKRFYGRYWGSLEGKDVYVCVECVCLCVRVSV
jgi:predicted N-acyltransferase